MANTPGLHAPARAATQPVMLRFPALMLMALAAGAALAEPAPPEDPMIEVVGQKISRADARRMAQAHARAVMGTPVGGQNARWAEPLCIGAAGIRAPTATAVIDRIEALAQSLGLRLAGRGCRPNVLLLFVADGDAALAEIQRRRPDALSLTGAEDRKRLRQPALPVRWFYGQGMEGTGGRQMAADAPSLFGTAGVLPDGLPVLNEGGASRISEPTQLSLIAATLLIDAPRADGVPLAALADFLGFAILSRTRIGAEAPPGSILGLFDPAASPRPQALSPLDRAFLKALYSTPINRPAATHRNLLADAMVRALEQGQ